MGREAAGLLPAAQEEGARTRCPFIDTRQVFRPNGVTALSDEDIRRLAPFAFVASAHEIRSHRHACIPTAGVIAGTRENRFVPMLAAQAITGPS